VRYQEIPAATAACAMVPSRQRKPSSLVWAAALR
jgi:hypothetical protein